MRFEAPIVVLLALCGPACAKAQNGAAAQPATTQVQPVRQSITVTAAPDRGLAGTSDLATSTAVVTGEDLAAQPGLTLDDSLHQVAGFQLFRRTSSWTANPTTEGVSLRGLGSTAASRSLVVSDEVPLNDPFGGWVHWDELPALALDHVVLLRGGASDLYGSSAIGGVVDLVPVVAWTSTQASQKPPALSLAADASGASEDTGQGDALMSAQSQRAGAALGAVSVLETGGYIPTAPAARGAVDTPAGVAAEAARLELWPALWPQASLRPGAKRASAFLRGNVLNEQRANGTRLQTNGTRLWRYTAGADVAGDRSTAALRLFGSRESYRQSFSAIAADRNSERLSRLQHVGADELGLAAHAARTFKEGFTAALGFDARDVRATDAETPVSTATGTFAATAATSARQRTVGGYAEAMWRRGSWEAAASVRADSFRTFDARQVSGAMVTPQPALAELVASPRAGLVRTLPHNLALTATAFRAFRGPTLNELYRTGQVGQQITLANSRLLAERATGAEGGVEWTPATLGRLRATYFWTEVNRPISAVLLSQTPTGAQTLQRQNLGQLQSRGLMVEAATNSFRGVRASFGYQLAVATVTAFNSASAAQANLTGKWLPQVPRESVTASVEYNAPRVAMLHVFASYGGRAFDDAANLYLLHPYARVDASAERRLGRGFAVFAGVQNLLDRSIEAGRTPALTLAAPRLVQGGVRYSFAR